MQEYVDFERALAGAEHPVAVIRDLPKGDG